MLAVVVVFLALAVLICAYVRRQRRTEVQVRDQQVRLRAQRQRYLAEREVQASAQEAFRKLLAGERMN